MNSALTFTNKQEYLAWRAQWRAEYAQLSQDIRDLKFCYRWSLRKSNDPKCVERYREIEKRLFSNANTCCAWKLQEYKCRAVHMLELRKESKLLAQLQYATAKAAKAAA